jgi:hypothetical protein
MISKGQGYRGFLRKGREKFWTISVAARKNVKKIRKTDRISIILGSIKCFPISPHNKHVA